MKQDYNFLQGILNSLIDHITVIDELGNIKYANVSWIRFGVDNHCVFESWEDVNYLEICDESAKAGDRDAKIVAKGIREVIANQKEDFIHEYPCHSQEVRRWFILRVSQFELNPHQRYISITHQDITQRKQAENKIAKLVNYDRVTGIANRVYFDECLRIQWRAHQRSQKPISLLMIDIDHFKQINDTYGHLFGDQCLKEVAEIMKANAGRPFDFCVRFGGDEFAILMGETDKNIALKIAETIRLQVELLNTKELFKSMTNPITVSVGVASKYAVLGLDPKKLIKEADELMYQAKQSGRNKTK